MCTGLTIYVCLLLHCTFCLQEKSSLSESIANKESQVSTTYVLITFSETTILASFKAFIHFMVLIGNTLNKTTAMSVFYVILLIRTLPKNTSISFTLVSGVLSTI